MISGQVPQSAHSNSVMMHAIVPGTAEAKTKSLNIVSRKRENERIERENHGLAKRLFENGGAISKRGLDREYNQIMQYKKMISKFKPSKKPIFAGRFSSLPPIQRRGSVPHDLENSEAVVIEAIDRQENTEMQMDRNSTGRHDSRKQEYFSPNTAKESVKSRKSVESN